MSGTTTTRRRAHLPRRTVAPLTVLAGGLLGSAGRALIASAWSAGPGRFPLSTLVINLAGSFALGLYLARRQRAVTGAAWLRFWAIGALGSFTTFSTFSVEVFRLMNTGASTVAAAYAGISTLGGVACAVLGERMGFVGR